MSRLHDASKKCLHGSNHSPKLQETVSNASSQNTQADYPEKLSSWRHHRVTHATVGHGMSFHLAPVMRPSSSVTLRCYQKPCPITKWQVYLDTVGWPHPFPTCWIWTEVLHPHTHLCSCTQIDQQNCCITLGVVKPRSCCLCRWTICEHHYHWLQLKKLRHTHWVSAWYHSLKTLHKDTSIRSAFNSENHLSVQATALSDVHAAVWGYAEHDDTRQHGFTESQRKANWWVVQKNSSKMKASKYIRWLIIQRNHTTPIWNADVKFNKVTWILERNQTGTSEFKESTNEKERRNIIRRLNIRIHQAKERLSLCIPIDKCGSKKTG